MAVRRVRLAPRRPRHARWARRGSGRLERRARGRGEFPDRIYGIASPRSVGGVSMLEAGALASPETVGNFVSQADDIQRAAYRLQDSGFDVLQITDMSINIAGARSTYEQAFGTTLVSEDRPTIKERGRVEEATFFDSPDTPLSGIDQHGRHPLRGRAGGRRARGAPLLHGLQRVRTAQVVLASRRASRRLARVQRRPRAPQRHHRPGRARGDGRLRLVPAPVLRAARLPRDRGDARAGHGRFLASTRSVMGPASRRTCSPSPLTSSCSRSRRYSPAR